jgi:sugar phosphate isomerase/epimerase
MPTRPKSSSRSATTKPPEDCRFVAKLYTNENVPLPVAEELRRLGHDVMTVQESDLGGQSIPDQMVLKFAIDQGRSLITLNRRHFVKLHEETPGHPGIIVCTTDVDFLALAARIDAAVGRTPSLVGKLIRVNRRH